MRIYNPQNQFGKELVTKELVNEKLLTITGYNLDATEPLAKGTLQEQIDNIVGGGLKYKVMELGDETSPEEGTWRWLKGLIDKSSKTEAEEAKIEQYVKTVILVDERSGKSGNIYTEYLVFDKGTGTAHNYAYEKIGEIGGDVEEMIKRIEKLETDSIGTITTPSGTGAETPGAIVIDVDAISGEIPKKAVTISAAKAASDQYGVVKLSTGLPDSDPSTEIVVTEKVLADVKAAVEKEIEDLTDGDTVAVGQVRVAEVTIANPTTAEHVSGVFSIIPKTGAGNVKILTVEDNSGEEWSHKSVAGDTVGVQFQVWNNESATKTDWDDMGDNKPSGFKVTYVVLTLAS